MAGVGIGEVWALGLELFSEFDDTCLALNFHEGLEVGHGFFHHAGGLDDLGEEHFSCAEKIADDAHAIHEGAFDDGKGLLVFLEGLGGVLDDEFVDALEEGVLETLLHGGLTPGEVLGELLGSLAFEGFGEVEEALGRAIVFIEEDVLYCGEEILWNLIVNFEHAGIHDAHVHACLSGVVEEGRVHCFAHGVVSSEREGDVRDTAGDLGEGEVFFDPAGGVDEVESVVVVLFDSGGDGEDVGVKNDVLGREADFIDKDVVGALADAALVLVSGGLALFVKGHDDDSSAVVEDVLGIFSEGVFAFFEGDGVDDAFALEVLESFFNDLPFRGIDHDGNGLDVGLGLDEIEEARYHGLTVDEAVVEADVDDVCAIDDLLAGDFERGFEVSTLNEFTEARGASDVGAFPDHEEVFVGRVIVGFGSGKAEKARDDW